MSISKAHKTQLISDYRINEQDTGSPEVQVALLTAARIEALIGHLNTHKHDESSRAVAEVGGSAQAPSGLFEAL